MKHESGGVVFAILALLLFNIVSSGFSLESVKADTQNTTSIQFYSIGGGQTSLTNETVHTSANSAKLAIPSNAKPGSSFMALYTYNTTLNSIKSLQFFASYTNAAPRFVILLDINNTGFQIMFFSVIINFPPTALGKLPKVETDGAGVKQISI